MADQEHQNTHSSFEQEDEVASNGDLTPRVSQENPWNPLAFVGPSHQPLNQGPLLPGPPQAQQGQLSAHYAPSPRPIPTTGIYGPPFFSASQLRTRNILTTAENVRLKVEVKDAEMNLEHAGSELGNAVDLIIDTMHMWYRDVSQLEAQLGSLHIRVAELQNQADTTAQELQDTRAKITELEQQLQAEKDEVE